MPIPIDLGDKGNDFHSFFLVIKVRIVDAGMTELGPSKETVRIGKGHVLLSFYGPVHFVHMTVVIIVVVVPVSPQETAVFSLRFQSYIRLTLLVFFVTKEEL